MDRRMVLEPTSTMPQFGIVSLLMLQIDSIVCGFMKKIRKNAMRL